MLTVVWMPLTAKVSSLAMQMPTLVVPAVGSSASARWVPTTRDSLIGRAVRAEIVGRVPTAGSPRRTRDGAGVRVGLHATPLPRRWGPACGRQTAGRRHEMGTDRAVQIDRDLLVRPAPRGPIPPGPALNLAHRRRPAVPGHVRPHGLGVGARSIGVFAPGRGWRPPRTRAGLFGGGGPRTSGRSRVECPIGVDPNHTSGGHAASALTVCPVLG